MIKIENVETFGWEAALRGMRNPLNSWEKNDSYVECPGCAGLDCWGGEPKIGQNDEKLMKALIKGGPVECKFRRMIHVQMDITAPLYWWKEFDTYKVGTVANSCSTMHKIHAKEFTMEDFSTEHLFEFTPYAPMEVFSVKALCDTIKALNYWREKYLETKSKDDWWQMIQLLPTSYNQKRTVDLSYEVLANIYHHRKDHKLDEWRELCFNMSEILPYSWIFTENWEGKEQKEPQYKKLLLKIADLVKEGKIQPVDVLDAVGFTFGLDLNRNNSEVTFYQNVDSETIMNLKSKELEDRAEEATELAK